MPRVTSGSDPRPSSTNGAVTPPEAHEARRFRALFANAANPMEDEDAVRGIASAVLRRHGYDVLEVSTPWKTWTWAARE